MRYRSYMEGLFYRAGIAFAILLFLAFFALFWIYYEVRIVGDSEAESAAIATQVGRACNRYQRAGAEFAEDVDVQSFLSGNTALASSVNRKLYTFTQEGTMPADFVLLDADGMLLSSSLYRENQAVFLESAEFRAMFLAERAGGNAPPSEGAWRTPLQYEQVARYYFFQPIYREERMEGAVIFLWKEEGFQALARGRGFDALVVLDPFDRVVYATTPLFVDEFGKMPAGLSGGVFEEAGTRFYSAIASAGHLRIVSIASLRQASRILETGVMFLCVLIVLIFCATPVFVQKATARALCSLEGMLAAFRAYRSGNLSYRADVMGNFEEFQALYADFNRMAEEIERLFAVNEELAERKRQMEVRQLKSQFNPHFAFNVLETLRYMIPVAPEEAMKMTLAFANLMRYSIHDSNPTVALKVDLEHIKDYLILQKMRYGERLRYEIQIPEELGEVQVPKLLLQPIVENSIVHGLEKVKNLKLTISARCKESDLELSLHDDGPGLTAAKAQELRALLQTEGAAPSRIGMYHVHRVLRLLYGAPYGLTFHTMQGDGMEVLLRMPLGRKADC